MMSELDPNQACRRSAALRAFTLRPRDAVVISTDNAPYDWPPLAANPDPMTTEILQQQRIEWRSRPAREHTGRAMIGLVIIAGLTAVIFAGFGPWWALGACVVLLLSLHRFYFPSRFVIDEQGITAAFLLRSRSLRWQDIRRFVHDQNGGYLSTRSRASWLDAYTGMHLLLGPQPQTVINCIKHQLQRTSRLSSDAPKEARPMAHGPVSDGNTP